MNIPILQAVFANILWGVTPLYFYYLGDISPFLLLFAQILSTFFWLLLCYHPKIVFNKLIFHIPSAFFLSLNWIVYLLAVVKGHVIEASIGYLLMPVITMLIGVVFFSEKISASQTLGVTICILSVLFYIYSSDITPWYGLVIAASFSIYISINKHYNNNNHILSLKHETLLMLPFSSILLYYGVVHDVSAISKSQIIMLSLFGLVVIFPLVIFINAAKKIELTKIGACQFISPFVVAMLSIFFFDENVSHKQIILLISCLFGASFIVLSHKVSGRIDHIVNS